MSRHDSFSHVFGGGPLAECLSCFVLMNGQRPVSLYWWSLDSFWIRKWTCRCMVIYTTCNLMHPKIRNKNTWWGNKHFTQQLFQNFSWSQDINISCQYLPSSNSFFFCGKPSSNSIKTMKSAPVCHESQWSHANRLCVPTMSLTSIQLVMKTEMESKIWKRKQKWIFAERKCKHNFTHANGN